MPEWWFDWSGWIFGLIGAIGVFQVWLGITQTKTTNTITDGSRNAQKGGAGTTNNTVERGDNNDQRG